MTLTCRTTVTRCADAGLSRNQLKRITGHKSDDVIQTTVTRCADAGRSRNQLKRITGHKSDAVIQTYIDNSKRNQEIQANTISISESVFDMPPSSSSAVASAVTSDDHIGKRQRVENVLCENCTLTKTKQFNFQNCTFANNDMFK